VKEALRVFWERWGPVCLDNNATSFLFFPSPVIPKHVLKVSVCCVIHVGMASLNLHVPVIFLYWQPQEYKV